MAYEKQSVYPSNYSLDNPYRVQSEPECDYVQNGVIYTGAKAESVMVTSQSDLEQLSGYAPGTIAYTAGFTDMWQLAADGTWVSCV